MWVVSVLYQEAFMSHSDGVFGQRADFVAQVWQRQRMPDGVGCVAFRDDEVERWIEMQIRTQSADEIYGRGEGEAGDWEGEWASYFCPNLFMRRRQKEQTLPGRWLYQDLDEVSPARCSIPPTVWWETSPGRYQGLWLMQRSLLAVELAALNKALNRSCGADPGTWNLTRMLRIPGTWNGKRECRVSPAYIYSKVKPDDLRLVA
jgi:hypothetical protein